MGSNGEVTPVFSLTKEELWPIIEEAAGTKIASFEVCMEHQPPEPYGYQAEKAIPTFAYVTETSQTGKVTAFVKRFHRTGLAESQQYCFLHSHQAPVPRMYGAILGSDEREILFLEHVEIQHPIGTLRELLSMMARFHAIRPSTEYSAWLEQASWRFLDRLRGAESALDLIWEHAQKGELGQELKGFCSSSVCGLSQLQSLVRQVVTKCEQMSQGLIHTDFSRENVGRRKSGELLLLDVEWVSLGPRFFDVAGWLFSPPEGSTPDPRVVELTQHYLDEYARWRGSAPSLDEFFDTLRILRLADIFRYFDWNLKRGLGGWESSPADENERKACCDHLHKIFTMLLDQNSGLI